MRHTVIIALTLMLATAHADDAWEPVQGNYNPDSSTTAFKAGDLDGVKSCTAGQDDPKAFVDAALDSWRSNPLAYLGADKMRLGTRDLLRVTRTVNQAGGWDPLHRPDPGNIALQFSLVKPDAKSKDKRVKIWMNVVGIGDDGHVVCHDNVNGYSLPVVKL